MTKKLIEIVCKGNVGRSPVAELIAKDHLKKVGASEDYGIISSGINVKRNQDGLYSPEELKHFVDFYRKIGHKDESIENLDRVLREGSPDLASAARKLIDYAIQDEVNERSQLLKELEINGEPKKVQDQTVARPNVISVLPVDRKNYSKVLPIYANSGETPIISVLSVLATGNLTEEIKLSEEVLDKEGLRESYKRAMEQIVEYTPKAVNKIIGV